MHQHSTERTKELKRKRQRRKACLKEKRVLFAATPVSRSSSNVVQKVSGIPQRTRSIVQLTDYSREFISYINNELPNVPANKIWFDIPKELRTEIINNADFLISHHSFAAPSEWDGNLKSALELMREGKIPSGFRNFVDSYRNKKKPLKGLEKYLRQLTENFSEED